MAASKGVRPDVLEPRGVDAEFVTGRFMRGSNGRLCAGGMPGKRGVRGCWATPPPKSEAFPGLATTDEAVAVAFRFTTYVVPDWNALSDMDDGSAMSMISDLPILLWYPRDPESVRGMPVRYSGFKDELPCTDPGLSECSFGLH